MRKEVVNTGGLKEFHITKEDRNRWESDDTESTRDFKDELRFWREHPIRYWWKHNKEKVIIVICIVLALIIIFFKYFN